MKVSQKSTKPASRMAIFLIPTFLMPFFLILTLGLCMMGCSSAPPVKSLAYAKLHQERTFEYDFPTVWKGIEETLRRYKIAERDPDDVSPTELKKLTHRSLQTDWIYGESRNKYQEYQVNGIPKKTALQSRFKYHIDANRVMGGVRVRIQTDEEIQKLNSDGTPDGYSREGEPDPSRAAGLLDKINTALLSLPNTN